MGLLYDKEQKTAGRIPSATDVRQARAKSASVVEIEDPELDTPEASEGWEDELEPVDEFSLEGGLDSEDDPDDLL